ncbi:hypothetical protein [Burkholderia pseudomultivorans]|uniref:FAD dependent oxidoreductase domain-containing protein n=1 Tax=Burkholderia pseudomultivorans TaxID=1207504 RepID=A0ABU2E8F1_9BURK|nr:hypothetical protein [Burkholderia pseudomultivorans]MDR8729980.1 hypothetical protein [Burkholderia pseudomultivorans]MDR8735822.1 hypothetical protein [Burkholderia pseudomultivorans]MDR8744363.1 hypothetical protein [Burkholderia pseudomultivorans]MDR8756122.1 hypothetical protein [Burkholderia pseudomultivorans]MDR8780977.1 hypothetical protein [Burkholderia pseudomultivorans]
MTKKANGLALLAHKCAARTFDLSTGVLHASMRDQIVRAQLLMRDLKENEPGCRRVLIVGGGVGGISAAAMASELDMEVLLVDSKREPFSLQAGVTSRYVGPFMYEWPELGYDCQTYPPVHPLDPPHSATPTWTANQPISAADFANRLKTWLAAHTFSPGKARFFFGAVPTDVATFVRDFVAHHGSASGATTSKSPEYVLPEGCLDHKRRPAPTGAPFVPDYVVLAAGMGEERVALPDFEFVEGKRFWDNDDLKLPQTCFGNSCVFGGGDGALQDVLRLLTIHNHPLQMIEELKSDVLVANAIEKVTPRLESLERQSRLVTTWSGASSFDPIDRQCQTVAMELARAKGVRDAVWRQLRKGSGEVHHVMREQYFGKAYLLNRFSVHLIEQCQVAEERTGTLTYHPHRKTNVADAKPAFSAGKRGYSISLDTSPNAYFFQWVAVRYGADPDELPQSKMVKLNETTQADRTSMAAIPLPLVVPK